MLHIFLLLFLNFSSEIFIFKFLLTVFIFWHFSCGISSSTF
jgi:hypothetical protein